MPSVRRLVLTDLDRGIVHEFRDAEVRIGRDPACEVCVADAPASAGLAAVHARIVPRPTGWSLSDERTPSGTHVNHVRLVGSDQAILGTGDIIRLGTGTAARRFRVARIETLQPRNTAPVRASDLTSDSDVSATRIAASAVGGAAAGAAAGTAALASRGGFSASMITGAAVAGAAAGAAGIAVAADADGDSARRASRLFESLGRTADPAPTAASIWAGAVVGTVITATAAGGYQAIRVERERPSAVTVAAADAPAEAGAASDRPDRIAPAIDAGSAPVEARDAGPEAARLEAAAARMGHVVAEVTAWYRGRPVRLAGIVLSRAGDVASAAVAVRAADGSAPDSVVVRWPDGMARRAAPRASARGVGMLALHGWSGQWLADEGRGALRDRPSWTAVVGIDRDALSPAVTLSTSAARATADGEVEVRGASERLLPGSALVDQDGRIVGVWLGGGRGVPLARALDLLTRGGRTAGAPSRGD